MLGLILALTLASSEPMSRVVVVEGLVQFRTDNTTTWQALDRGASLHPGDTVKTGESGRLRMLMANRSVVDLAPNSELRLRYISGPPKQRKVGLRMFIGRLWARVSGAGREERFEVETENAVAGVRGTSFFMDVDPVGETLITVSAGVVEVATAEGEPFVLRRFQRGVIGRGTRRILRDLNAAQIVSLRQSIAPRLRLGALGKGRRFARLEQRFKGRLAKQIKRRLRKGALKNLRGNVRRDFFRKLALKIDPARAQELFERFRR